MTLEEAKALLRDTVAKIRAADIIVEDGSCGCCGGSSLMLGYDKQPGNAECISVEFWATLPDLSSLGD